MPCRDTSAPSSSTSIPPSPGCRPPPRGGLRLRQHRDPRRLGRDRSRPLRPRVVVGVEQMKTVDSDHRRRLPRHRGLVRARSQGHRVPVPEALRPPRRRVRQALRPQGRAPRAHLGGQLLERQAQPAGADAQLVHDREPRVLERQVQPVIGGRIKISDCSQVTDGAASLFLASEKSATDYAKRGKQLDDIPRILGWGHHTAPIEFDAKVAESHDNPYVLPHTRQTILDAFKRAGVADVGESTRSRRTTASPPPSTWPSTTSASPSRASRGRPSRTASSRWAASCRSTRAAASSARASGRRHRRPPGARLPQAGHRHGGRLPGRRRQDHRDAEHRRQRHHQLRLRRRQVEHIESRRTAAHIGSPFFFAAAIDV